MDKKKIIIYKHIYLLFFILICTTIISIGYAALSTSLNVSGDLSLRITADVRITDFKVKLLQNGAYETYDCTYSRNSTTSFTTLPAIDSVAVYEGEITNYTNKKYYLKEVIVKNNDNQNISYIFEGFEVGDIIPADSVMNFNIKFLYQGDISEDITTSLSLEYVFEEYDEDIDGTLLKDKILNDNGGTVNINAKGSPDFTKIPSTDEGMYGSTDNEGETYYFRGNTQNNYVLFAGFYWRIVRINGNGSTRLIYQGTTADGNGNISSGYYEDSTASGANKTRYHSFVKYFTSSGSKMKTTIDTWYKDNILTYSSWLDNDTGYCNDYSTTSGSYSDYGTSSATFSGQGRLNSNSPTFSCSNTYYETPTASITGTKNLTYPIGSISMDEVMFAGGSNNTNNSYYLYTGSSYFTTTPDSFNYTSFIVKYYYPYILAVNTSGQLEKVDVYTQQGYRPVVNLANYVYWSSGTGTKDDPYIPKLESVPVYQFALTPVPSDANVTIKVNNEVVTEGIGESIISAKYKDKITYSVSKDGYLTKEGTYIMGKKDYFLTVNLTKISSVLSVYIRNMYENASDKVETDMRNQYGFEYSASTNLRDDRLGGTIATGGNIRYSGSNPNNYIYFNCSDYSNQTESTCEKWRIVGVFGNKVKLVRTESIGMYSWTSNSGNTINKWDPDSENNYTGAAIMNLLNPGYENLSANNSLYWNSASGNCYNENNLSSTACDFSTTGLKNDTTRNLISTETYYLYSPSIGELYADELYVQERGASPGSQYDGSGDSPQMSRNGTWNGKIGLLYPSDHAYGATPGSCLLPLYNWASPCIKSDWLAYATEERFLTPSYRQKNAWFARKIGTIQGHVASGDAADAKNIRPVLYLYENQKFKSGDGSSSNPYQLLVE